MSDRQRKLIRVDRTCVCCGRVAPHGKSIGNNGDRMLSITPLLYRGGGRTGIKAGRKISICESCFAKACAGTIWGLEGAKLWPAVRDRLVSLYKQTIEEERAA
jgi:hypothetical protein